MSGWLLLVPPQVPEGTSGRFNIDAPPDRWVQLYALDKATECETVKGALRQEQLAILNERDDEPLTRPEPPLSQDCEERLKKPSTRKGLDEMICEVLKKGVDEEAKLTKEQKDQLQKEWERVRARKQAERRARQASALEELERLDHAKCVPADAVYRAPK